MDEQADFIDRATAIVMKPEIGVPLLCAAASIAAFWPALRNGWVNWDDTSYIVGNPALKGFTAGNLRWMFTTTLSGPYQPLSWLSLAFDQALWGQTAAGYHVTNVLLHGLGAGIFCWAAAELLKSLMDVGDEERAWWGAGVATLLYFWHPLRVESVAWVSERRDVLAAVFYFAAIGAHVRARSRGERRWRVISCAAAAAAMLSKASAVTLPATLYILDCYPLRRPESSARLWREKWPYLLMAAPILVVGASGQLALPGPYHYSLGERIALAAYRFWFYLGKTAWPSGLSPVYDTPFHFNPLAPRWVAAVAGTALLAAVCWRERGRRPWLTAAAAHYAVVILPMLGLSAMSPQVTADRYAYLATAPLFLLAGAVFARAVREPGRVRAAAIASAAATAAVYLGLVRWQIPFWRDSESLWSRAVATNPGSAVARNYLGDVYAETRRLTAAAEQYVAAVNAAPEYAPAWYNLGRVAKSLGRDAEAEGYYRETIRRDPDMLAAYNNLGILLYSRHFFAEAIETFEAALARPSREEIAHERLARLDIMNNLGNAWLELANTRRALEAYDRALRYDPRFARTYYHIGIAYFYAGWRDVAVKFFDESLRLDPQNVKARENREKAYAEWKRWGRRAPPPNAPRAHVPLLRATP